MEGLEPTRREALDPKSSVSTNFTTSAVHLHKRSAKLYLFFKSQIAQQIYFELIFILEQEW